MKAVLIIDVPDNILLDFSKANIEIKESAYLVNKDESKWKYTRPIKIEDVPLRPLPDRESPARLKNGTYFKAYDRGWEACLDAISGETE